MEQRLKQYQQVDELIKKESTGSRQQLARKLKVSPATISRILEEMKTLGAPIAYCSSLKSYVYTIEGVFQIGFTPPRKISLSLTKFSNTDTVLTELSNYESRNCLLLQA